jgi:TonB-linked SusC/RagA family outer membrane protein
MRKKLFFLNSFVLSLVTLYTYAQNINVTGTVKEQSGDLLYGVNVTVKGTTNGTTTDANGKYSISVAKGQVLSYSYIGFTSQDVTVGNSNVLNITLSTDASVLGEVVVTALGVSREKRALQYSVTEVAGENFTKARVNNLGNALSGRIAGVNVTAPATGPAGSSRVIIRGNKTLGGANQPLYVIDGVPMDNSQQGTAGLWGGSDGGDGLSSLNPDDIESITVLKGANAAALYGSRGGNGVINITTKKGTKRKGVGVEYGSNLVLEDIYNLAQTQKIYGQGAYISGVATAPTTIQQASDWGLQGWGPKMDGRKVMGIDGVERPYSYAGDNFSRFYNQGKAWTNSVALTGGNGQQNFRLSLADLRSTSIVPNSGFDRTNVSVSTNSKFGKKLSVDGKVLYSKELAKNRPRVSDSPGNPNESVWRLPANINIENTKGDPNKLGAIPADWSPAVLGNRKVGTEMLSNYSDFWGSNAYWAAHQFIDNSKRDRITASAQMKYDITDFLYVTGRLSMDNIYTKKENLTPQGTGYQQGGGISEYFQNIQENNMDFMVGYDDNFGKFSVNAFVGGNQQRSKFERIEASGNGFSVPFFHALNAANNRNFGYGYSQSGINSAYGSAEVGYDNYLFLTATARKDWFSILNPASNSVLYPSIGGSFVFTDAFKDKMPSWLSFGKLRASWAQVGLTGSLGAYQTTQPYSLNGSPHLGINMASFANKGTIANPLLSPALSTELEFGLDMRLYGGRLGLDIGYYSQKTTDDILNATISTASGFNSTTVNIGQLQNKGLEFLLTGTPIKNDNFTWDVSLNFAKNNNKVLSLIDGSTELVFEESRTRTTFIKHIVGQPYGVITGVSQKMLNGKPVFTAEGLPVRSDVYEVIGNSVANFTGGLSNNLSYKSFNLNFLIDVKMGGDLHSGTNQRLDQWGFSENSLIGREGQAPLTVNGVNEKGEPLTVTLTPQQAANYWNNLGDRNAASYIYDASFVKLRQFTLGYNLSPKLVGKTPFNAIGLSFVGRNLAILWKNIPNIDPESTYSFNGGAQGLEYFALPQTRSYGFNLNVSF